ncbi:hypothetical protein DOTSEDRAFT_68391 [Dothistroma septosporum NZE10]|uniref:Uncharacterized protein n=1 Tax=Dothistroma septosporum (strain NZE10 / CBS 128990) TaxID=675120 RepID=N1Q2Y8_DOTSN|nr:hypothetical protein DOTSEDRAFT_68391 [Dothistroma septosporum NZE10]
MLPSHSSDFTPVKIRGKRNAIPAEKWHDAKRRKPQLQRRRLSNATMPTSSSVSRKRLQTDIGGSPLEMLPAEVTHHIFGYSANVNLPLASRQLAAKLSKSTHLEHQLTETLLAPVLRLLGNEEAGAAQLSAATRLLNSRFVTFEFFKSWLRGHNEARSLHVSDGAQDEAYWRAIWTALQPSPTLLPPSKLISPPFTAAKTSFLAVLVQGTPGVSTIDPAYGEFALQGLQSAIPARQGKVVSLLLAMGVTVSTEMLRIAVIDSGCDKDIVTRLLDATAPADGSLPYQQGVDLLDPSLWAWAEKARKDGDDKGQWLVALLRDRQQRKATAESIA